MAAVSCHPVGNEMVYIGYDHSNIWISGQVVSATKKGLRRSDLSLRIAAKQLKRHVVKDREVASIRCYGSVPPDQDSVWGQFSKIMEVQSHKRSTFTGKEKEVDQSLVADLMADAAARAARATLLREYKPDSPELNQRVVYAIVGGDRDYTPLVQRILDLGFAVEIYSWRHSMWNGFYQFLSPAALEAFSDRYDRGTDQYNDLLSIHHLDAHFDEITFKGSMFDETTDRYIDFPGMVIVNVALDRRGGSVKESDALMAVALLGNAGHACEVKVEYESRSMVVLLDKRTTLEELDDAFDLVKTCVKKSHVLSIVEWTGEGGKAVKLDADPYDSDVSTYAGSQKTKKHKKHKKERKEKEQVCDTQCKEKEDESKEKEKDASADSSMCATCGSDEPWTTVTNSAQQKYMEKVATKNARRHTQRCIYREFCQKEFHANKEHECPYLHTEDEIKFFLRNGGKSPFRLKTYGLNVTCMKHNVRLQGPGCQFRHEDDQWCCFECLHFNEPEAEGCSHCAENPDLVEQGRPLLIPGEAAKDHFFDRTGSCRMHGRVVCKQCLFGFPDEPKPRKGKQDKAPKDLQDLFNKARKAKGKSAK